MAAILPKSEIFTRKCNCEATVMEDWGEKVPVHVVFAEVIVEEFGTSGQVDGQAT